jgi:hypothetical protein
MKDNFSPPPFYPFIDMGEMPHDQVVRFRDSARLCLIDPESNLVCYLGADGSYLFDVRPTSIQHD